MRRFEQHAKSAADGKRLLVYSAWRKHGTPTFKVLSEHADRASCAEAEIYEIARHGSVNDGVGYNIMGGGEGQQAGQNPRIRAIFSEKVWHNPERIRKCKEKLKGRKPSQATIDGYKEFCKTPAKAEAARMAWRSPEYRAMKSAATKAQMANGGAEYLANKFKGRPGTLNDQQREDHRERMKRWANTEEGKQACRSGYEAWASNPENIEKNQAELAKWRASEKNAENCRRMAKLAAAKCSKRIRNPHTGEVFDSQRAMAKAYGLSDATIAKRRNKGIYEYINDA